MKNLITCFVAIATVSCTTVPEKSPDHLINKLQNAKWVDLTHSFDENAIYWPTDEPYSHDTVSYGIGDGGYFYSSFKFAAEEHGGTHFDAPIHFSANKNTIEQVPLEQLNGPGIVINVSERALKNPDYLVSVEDITNWEASNGQIPEGAIILVNTGYSEFYHNRSKYLGTTIEGSESIPHLHFPGLSPKAATWLVNNRNIKAIGIDTASIDYGQSKDFKTHRILCDNGLTMYENVKNLELLPVKNLYVIALPMKIKGGSGSPLRIVAIFEFEQ